MRRKIIWGATAVVLIAGAASIYPGSPVREAAATVLQDRECWLQEAPADAEQRTIGLGDSITVGRHSEMLHVGANNSYFDVLACDPDSPVAFAGNAGIGHNTTSMMLARLQSDVLDHAPDQVLVLGGTNDVLLGQEGETIANLEQIRVELDTAGVESLFGLVPPLDVDPAGASALNEEIRAWAAVRDVELVDYWTPLAGPDGRFREGLTADGIHPSPTGARAMADAAEAALR
jgi:lysophospholipase L1-like esterase